MSTQVLAQPQVSSRRRERAIVVGLAALAALVVWGIFAAFTDIEAKQGDKTITVGFALVLANALGAALAGWASLAILERLTGKARTIWTVVASVALVLSFGGPLVNGVGSSKFVLALLHLVVGLIVIVGLRRQARAD